MRKAITALLCAVGLAVVVAGISTGVATTASADPCIGTWVIGVGGFTTSGPGVFGQDSMYVWSNQPVGYNTSDPASGVNELSRLFWFHRDQCPGDHIRIVAHSEGAAIAHAFVTANPDAGNANAVLLADPKYVGPPGGPGLAASGGFLGWPLAGVDDWFGGWPVLTVCNSDDVICNSPAGWFGYFTGAHGRYDMNGFDYGDWDAGVWFN